MMIRALVCCMLLSMLTPAYGMERFEIITTQQLKQMLEDRDAGKMEFLLVNTLERLIFEHHSIPGSINIPWSQVSEHAGDLGAVKDRMIITY